MVVPGSLRKAVEALTPRRRAHVEVFTVGRFFVVRELLEDAERGRARKAEEDMESAAENCGAAGHAGPGSEALAKVPLPLGGCGRLLLPIPRRLDVLVAPSVAATAVVGS
mmetsp:Transcript_61336/g.176512  ORF Transcript_61336/g.176512 Transcript_61336/m.176512 type:complete len:110 (-) Transcript_61336:293-622(-)